MVKTYSVEEEANAVMDMSSPSEFGESLDSTESVSEDSSWDEATTSSEIDENEQTDISSSAVKSTRKTPLHGIRGRNSGRIRIRGGRIALNSIRPVQLPMRTDTGTSDTDNINKDTDTFISDTNNNNKDFNDNETRR